ncbi:MAG: hypothetical protein AB1668_02460 [Nanoarchaeota archaeon]
MAAKRTFKKKTQKNFKKSKISKSNPDTKSTALKPKARQKWHAAPLKGSFMVLSILGFLISAYLVSNISYKIAFMLIFAAMFVASIISMTKAPMISK